MAIYHSLLLRCLFGHALLSCLKTTSARVPDGRDVKVSPTSMAMDHVLSSRHHHVEGEIHEEIHPGSQFRPLGPSTGGGFVSDWNRDWFQTGGGFGSRISQGKCVNIPENMTLCRGIGYNQMRLPNLLDHDSVKEATQQATSWVPLFNVRCHPDTQVFLCSLFAPVCLDRPIWPCKTLCEAVKAGCESRMLKYGFPWPDMLRCEQFPLDDDLCIGMRQDTDQSDKTSCPACVQAETFESIVDNFCSSDFAMKIRLEQAVISGSDMKLIAGKKKKAYKRGTLNSKELRDPTFYIGNGSQCKCKVAEDLMSDQRNAGFHLIMGNRKNDRLVLSFIERVDRKSADMGKAMDAIRKGKICRTGIQMITSDEAKKSTGKEKESKQPDKKTEGKKDKEIKGTGKYEYDKKVNVKKDEGKKGDGKKGGKKDDGKKEIGMKGDGRREAGKKGDGRNGDGKKRVGKNDHKKTENGKRSTDGAKSYPEKHEIRNKQEPKSSSKKSSS